MGSKVKVLLGCAGAGLLWEGYAKRAVLAEYLLTRYKRDCGAHVKINARRLEFGNTSPEGYGKNHGHPANAGDRYGADTALTRLADDLGLQRYDLSLARRTARMATGTGLPILGRRRCHWVSDYAA